MTSPIGATERLHALTLFARSAGDDEQRHAFLERLLATHLDELAVSALEVGFALGPPLPAILESLIATKASAKILDQLAERFETDLRRRLLPLRPIAEAVSRRRLEIFLEDLDPADAEELAEIARMHIRLGGYRLLAGDPEQALEHLEAAREFLGGVDPEQYKVERASVAGELAMVLRDLDRREEALDAADESILRMRDLAREDSIYLPDLAAAFLNLGPLRSELGDERGALRDVRRSVALFRRLVRRDPERFRADLALAELSLGIRHRWIGDYPAARRYFIQSVEQFERLAEALEVAYTSRLAQGLQNLAAAESDLGSHEKAEETAQRAAEIYRRLAADGGDAGQLALAESLRELSGYLLGIARPKESLAVTEEGLALTHSLRHSRLAGVEECRADLLVHRSLATVRGGRFAEAVRSGRHAIRIYRVLHARQPETYVSELATALNNLGTTLRIVDRRSEAIPPLEEAANLWKTLAAREPAAYSADLAGAWANLAASSLDADRPTEAREYAQRGVEVFRTLATEHTEAYGIRLAQALRVYRKALEEVGALDEAWQASREAIEVLINQPNLAGVAGALALVVAEEHEDLSVRAGHDPEADRVEALRKRFAGRDAQSLLGMFETGEGE
ncbi:MAG: tetratricopeptide repeat protein [Acidobacteriota bacterium]